MWKKLILIITVSLLLFIAGCAGVQGDDYEDAPESIQDGSLDYQDYQEANCPYLEGSLDQKTMEKCNEWIRSKSDS